MHAGTPPRRRPPRGRCAPARAAARAPRPVGRSGAEKGPRRARAARGRPSSALGLAHEIDLAHLDRAEAEVRVALAELHRVVVTVGLDQVDAADDLLALDV